MGASIARPRTTSLLDRSHFRGLDALVVASWVAAVTAVVLTTVSLGSWIVDDAGISLAYARNLAQGYGLRPTRGADVLEGFSNPAWVALLGVARALGAPLIASAKVIGLAGTTAACALVLREARQLGHSARERAELVLTLGLCAPLWLWANSGLENGAWTACLTAVVLLRRPSQAAVAVALGIWLRPEAPLLLASALCARHLLGRGGLHLLLGTGLAATLLLYGLRFTTLGTWWPQTAAAKLEASLLTRSLRGAVYIVISLGWLALLPLLPGLRRMPPDSPLRRPLWAVLALATGTGLALIYMGGDWMRYGRLAVAIVPLATLVGTAAASRYARPLLYLTWALQLVVFADVLRRPPLPQDLVEELGALADTVRRDACPHATELQFAGADVGGLAYGYPDARIVDLAGLITRLPTTSWEQKLREHPTDLVMVHGPWVRRTGLDTDTLERAGYRTLCTRPPGRGRSEAQFPAQLYLHTGCTHSLHRDTAATLDAWCRRAR